MTSFEAIREFNRGRADDSSIGAEQPFEADGPVGGIAPRAAGHHTEQRVDPPENAGRELAISSLYRAVAEA